MIPGKKKALGIILMLIAAVLNFYYPHFILQHPTRFNSNSYLLEFNLLLVFLAFLIAAFGIFRNKDWGWTLGVIVSGIAFVFYIAQETVGFGLPKNWFEPVKIAAFIVEFSFIILAVLLLRKSPQSPK